MTQTSRGSDLIMTKLSEQQSEIEFDEKAHSYTVRGKAYPSVTQVLKDVGLIDTDWFSDGGIERGIWVHTLCERADRPGNPEGGFILADGGLDEYAGYTDAWETFKSMSGFCVLAIESPFYSERLGMAGRADRIGYLNGKLTILDIKSGVKQKWHGLQLAGYKLILERVLMTMAPIEVRGVYLKSSGKWTMQDYTMDSYISDMMACLQMHKVKQRY